MARKRKSASATLIRLTPDPLNAPSIDPRRILDLWAQGTPPATIATMVGLDSVSEVLAYIQRGYELLPDESIEQIRRRDTLAIDLLQTDLMPWARGQHVGCVGGKPDYSAVNAITVLMKIRHNLWGLNTAPRLPDDPIQRLAMLTGMDVTRLQQYGGTTRIRQTTEVEVSEPRPRSAIEITHADG